MAYNFTIGTSGRWTAVAVCIQNPHASVIYDVVSSNVQTGGAATITAANITTLNANSIHCAVFGADGSNNVFAGAPGSYTAQQNSGDQCVMFSTLVIASPGATGSGVTATLGSSNGAFAFSFAIRDNGSGTTSVRSSSVGTGASGTAVSVATPAGATSGDLIIVVVHCNGVTTIVDNNGGTPFTEDVNDYQEASAGLTASLFSLRLTGGGGGPTGPPPGTLQMMGMGV